MVDLTSLWLAILVAAVFVFVASSVIHMALPIHKNDCKPLPNESEALATLRKLALSPGSYGFPRPASMKECSTPEFAEKMKRGPVGFMTVLPSGALNMNKSLLQWFVFCIVISLFAAYIGRFSLPAGADYGDVFRVTASVALLGYAFPSAMDSIWKGVSWVTTFKFFCDGVVYALVTGGAFGWLWPDAGA